MAIQTKVVQLDLFINDKRAIEEKMKMEREDSTKKQIRLLMHLSHETQRRLDKQEEMIQSLVDFIVEEEKNPRPIEN
jgi:hypothetical protein